MVNPEVSRHKFDNFVKQVSVQQAMDHLTAVLSEMYENDQHHQDKNPEDTFRVKLGLAPLQRGDEVDPEEIENLKSQNEELRSEIRALQKQANELQDKLDASQ